MQAPRDCKGTGPHFCVCYFNAHPVAHHESGKTEHYCKFNNAYKVNKGHYGSTDLAGAKFWLSGDLGGDFSQGQMPPLATSGIPLMAMSSQPAVYEAGV
jgi:hypothetical protein